MVNLQGLKGMSNYVRGELDKAFMFSFADGELRVSLGDMSSEEGYREFLRISGLRGYSEQEIRQELEYLTAWNAGTCVYAGDVPGSDTDYAVFVNGVIDVTPAILGQMISYGEHMSEHAKRIGSIIGYENEFSQPCISLIGYLGFGLIEKDMARAGNDTHIDPARLEFREHQQAAYELGRRLEVSGKRIPYQDLFHAKDRHEVMGILKGLVRA